ncbi:ribonuclease Oy-like [Clytia hemisphaerica]|uniref:Uncharacterized protein n=1 Tax=Clytia hemisphaerica TaxID=252671 RepID=A0A7M5WIC0_9CNID
MKICFAVLLILAVLAIVESRWRRHRRHHHSKHHHSKHGSSKQVSTGSQGGNHDMNNWDFFMLVQQWPLSSCEKENVTHEHTCVIPKYVDGWTLHGLWPSTNVEKNYPTECTNEKFDPEEVRDLKPRMLKYWPNMFVDSDKNHFWAHEYEKHGTCAESVPGFKTEHEFFNSALNLRDEHDIGNILASQEITPRDQPYEGSDLNDALNKELGKTGCVQCQKIKDIGYVISAAVVCLSKSKEVIDCPYCEHKCLDEDKVYYQPIRG